VPKGLGLSAGYLQYSFEFMTTQVGFSKEGITGIDSALDRGGALSRKWPPLLLAYQTFDERLSKAVGEDGHR